MRGSEEKLQKIQLEPENQRDYYRFQQCPLSERHRKRPSPSPWLVLQVRPCATQKN